MSKLAEIRKSKYLSQKLERKEEIMKDVLFNVYCEWRKVSQEMLEDGISGSVNCGEVSVRKDFSQYAGLENEITFEEMLELEERFEN